MQSEVEVGLGRHRGPLPGWTWRSFLEMGVLSCVDKDVKWFSSQIKWEGHSGHVGAA